MKPHHSRFFWLLVITLLIAAGLRLWEIGTLPPGLHYDEAADTIIAQQIARGESAPIFVAAYTGKEVLFFYWAAAWMKLIGPSLFAMRLAAALLGVLTVAVTYRVVYEMFASGIPRSAPVGLPPARKKREAGCGMVALLTTIFIAASFWHVLMSRLGFRSIGEPFIQALALAALFRGLRLDRWGWITTGGALIGLNLYTYLAARLFPVAVAAIFFFLIAFDRGRRRLRLAQFLVVALAALVAAATMFATEVKKHDAQFSFKLPPNIDASTLADLCAYQLVVDGAARQAILECLDPRDRVEMVISQLALQQGAMLREGAQGSVLN